MENNTLLQLTTLIQTMQTSMEKLNDKIDKIESKNKMPKQNKTPTSIPKQNIPKAITKVTYDILLRIEIFVKQATLMESKRFPDGSKLLKEFGETAKKSILGKRNIGSKWEHKMTPEAHDIFVKGFHAMNEAVHSAGLVQLKHEIMFKLQELNKLQSLTNRETLKKQVIFGIRDYAKMSNFKGKGQDIHLDWILNNQLEADVVIDIILQYCNGEERWYTNLKNVLKALNEISSERSGNSSLNPNPTPTREDASSSTLAARSPMEGVNVTSAPSTVKRKITEKKPTSDAPVDKQTKNTLDSSIVWEDPESIARALTSSPPKQPSLIKQLFHIGTKSQSPVSNNEEHKCILCNTPWPSAHKKNGHIQGAHKINKPTLVEPIPFSKTPWRGMTPEGSWKCPFCETSGDTPQSYIAHMSEIHKIAQEVMKPFTESDPIVVS